MKKEIKEKFKELYELKQKQHEIVKELKDMGVLENNGCYFLDEMRIVSLTNEDKRKLCKDENGLYFQEEIYSEEVNDKLFGILYIPTENKNEFIKMNYILEDRQ